MHVVLEKKSFMKIEVLSEYTFWSFDGFITFMCMNDQGYLAWCEAV